MFPPKTEDDLKQLAIDYVDGKVFTSMEVTNALDLRIVFLPLTFMKPEDANALDDVGLIYEYYHLANSGSVNGKPIFLSCHLLSKTDFTRFADFVNRYLDYRKAF